MFVSITKILSAMSLLSLAHGIATYEEMIADTSGEMMVPNPYKKGEYLTRADIRAMTGLDINLVVDFVNNMTEAGLIGPDRYLISIPQGKNITTLDDLIASGALNETPSRKQSPPHLAGGPSDSTASVVPRSMSDDPDFEPGWNVNEYNAGYEEWPADAIPKYPPLGPPRNDCKSTVRLITWWEDVVWRTQQVALTVGYPIADEELSHEKMEYYWTHDLDGLRYNSRENFIRWWYEDISPEIYCMDITHDFYGPWWDYQTDAYVLAFSETRAITFTDKLVECVIKRFKKTWPVWTGCAGQPAW